MFFFTLTLARATIAGLLMLSLAHAAEKTPASDEQSDLTMEQAKERKARLSNIAYSLKVDLSDGNKKDSKFAGDLTVRFDLKNTSKDLRIELFKGEVTKLVVNGTDVPTTAKRLYWIDLPKSALKAGTNTVAISYRQEYSTTGEGLHRFFDPEDGRVYLHTQFETFDANRFMPVFDQPDLRATLAMEVTAPKDWTVITGTAESSVKAVGAKAKHWVFPATGEISSYLFSLHAGPYAMFKDTYKRADGSTVPLRLFGRQSLRRYIDHKDFFKVSKQALQYFEGFFATPYPFGKLDQVIPPEFNSGGMENVAAITYSERTVPRTEPTRRQRRDRAGLIMHEIAHMWYGDLVTMAWWNDLWLNESFASIMAQMGLDEATEYKEAWQTFAAYSKLWAYTEDAMITTHPIEGAVNTAKVAESIFDGITYDKGASTLKQLMFYMTPEAFREGMRVYFKTHAWKNTTRADFIAALQTQTKKNLSLWAERWLQQSGTDRVTASWNCEGGRLKAVDLKLEPTPGRKFRPQSMLVGFYQAIGQKTVLETTARVDFETSGSQTVKGDWACPQFVYPNTDDHAYVNVRLDAKSLEFLTKRLAQVDDLIVRSLVWNDLWRMVRDAELPLKTYVDVVTTNFPTETNEVISGQIVNTIDSPWGGASILYYWPSTAPQAARTAFVKMVEDNFIARIHGAKAGSDDQKFWFDNLVRLAETPKALDQIHAWYANKRVGPKFALDVDRKWKIARTLRRYKHPKADAVLQAMKKEDPSDRGRKSAIAAEVVHPDVQVKKQWIDEVTLGTSKRSYDEIRTAFRDIFPLEQTSMRMGFAEQFYQYLEKNRNSEDRVKVGTILDGILPLACDPTSAGRLKGKVTQYNDIDPSIKKDTLMSVDEDERCQRVRAASGF